MQINNVFNTFPPGVIIGGNCYFNQTAKPTTRPDGSALVVGDKWNNPPTGVTGFWSGTNWLSDVENVNLIYSYSGSATFTQRLGQLPRNKQSLFSSIRINNYQAYTADASNRWEVYIAVGNRYAAVSSLPILTRLFDSNMASNTEVLITPNIVSPESPTGGSGLNLAAGWDSLFMQFTRVGAPSILAWTFNIYSREIL